MFFGVSRAALGLPKERISFSGHLGKTSR